MVSRSVRIAAFTAAVACGLIGIPVAKTVVERTMLVDDAGHVLRFSDRDGTVQRLSRYLRESDPQTVILGTSHIVQGLNTCVLPGVGKAGMELMNLNEAAAIIDPLFSSSRAASTLIVDLGILGQEENPPVPNLSSRIMWAYDLSHIKRLMLGRSAPLCDARSGRTSAADRSDEELRINREKLAKRFSVQDQVADMDLFLKALTPMCRRKQMTVALVTLPLLETQAVPPEIQRAEQVYRDGIGQAVQEADIACDLIWMSFLTSDAPELAEQNTDPTLWFDVNHFQPDYGAQLLDRVLKRIEATR